MTVIAALVTFWPTVLWVRMDDRPEAFLRHAPVWFIGSNAMVVGQARF